MERLKKIREQKGLTQKELANLISSPQQTISRFETGERKLINASGAVLLKLANALDCRIEDLIGNGVEDSNRIPERN